MALLQRGDEAVGFIPRDLTRRDGHVQPVVEEDRVDKIRMRDFDDLDGLLDVRESRAHEHAAQARPAMRVGDHALHRAHGRLVHAPMRRFIEREPVLAVVRVDRHHAAAGTRNANHFSQPGLRIVEVLEHALGAHGIEGAVRKRQRVDARDLELDRKSRRLRRPLRRGDHRLRRVDPRNPPLRPDTRRELDADFAPAAADVEHGRPRLQSKHFIALAPRVGEAIREHGEVVDEVRRAGAAVDV